MLIIVFIMNFRGKCQTNILIGVEATPQMSWLLNEDDLNNKAFNYLSTFNTSFGVSGQFGFTPHSAVGINLLYSFQGQRFKLDGVERNKHVDYIKIPIMYVCTTPISSNLLFIGKIGPQVGILTNAQLIDKEGMTLLMDQKSWYMKSDIGAAAYVGFGLKLGPDVILDASVRADYGFSNAEYKHNKLNINDASTIGAGNESASTARAVTHNMTAGISIGLRFLLREIAPVNYTCDDE